MMWDGIDKRKFPRVSYKCRVRITNRGKEELFETHTENIGAGGMCVILTKEFDLFRDVKIELYLPDTDMITCGGSIVWVIKRRKKDNKGSVEFDIGIEFTDISNKDRASITELVQKLLSE